MENLKDQTKQFQVAEIQLSYKSNVKPSLRPKINRSSDACEILRQSWDESKIELVEQFKIILTNRANRLSAFEAYVRWDHKVPKSFIRTKVTTRRCG